MTDETQAQGQESFYSDDPESLTLMTVQRALQVMGLKIEEVTRETLTASFRAQAKQLHPDVAREESASQYNDLVVAYRTLQEAMELDFPLRLADTIRGVASQLTVMFIGLMSIEGSASMPERVVFAEAIKQQRMIFQQERNQALSNMEKARREIKLMVRMEKLAKAPGVAKAIWKHQLRMTDSALKELGGLLRVIDQKLEALTYITEIPEPEPPKFGGYISSSSAGTYTISS